MKTNTILKAAISLILAAPMISVHAHSTYAQNVSSEEVAIINTTDSIKLAGTLTYPASGNLKAAIVLATGSGPQNRDEEMFGNRPFMTIANQLSDAGYAVLRMDDRGTAESEGDFASATTDDFLTDIASGLNWLKLKFPKTHCGVLGHSEGGSIAIKEAVNDSLCKFIITLGAPAWPGDSIIMSQCRLIATATSGRWDGEKTQRDVLDIVKSSVNDISAKLALRVVLTQALGPQAAMPQMNSFIDKNVDILTSPWYRNMIKYNPAEDIANVRVPWLALNGSLDFQVLTENLKTIKALCPQAITVELQNHNHLFQECTDGTPDLYRINGDISSQTISTIRKWLDTAIPDIK